MTYLLSLLFPVVADPESNGSASNPTKLVPLAILVGRGGTQGLGSSGHSFFCPSAATT